MKRIITFFSIVCLIVALAIPAFAAPGYPANYPLPPAGVSNYFIYHLGTYTYLYDFKDAYKIEVSDYLGTSKTYNENGVVTMDYYVYQADNNSWVKQGTKTQISTRFDPLSQNFVYCSMQTVRHADFIYYFEPYTCDGTCGNTDDNFDGWCDSCNGTYSLRNSSEYAYTHFVTFLTDAGTTIRAEYYSNMEFSIRGYKYGNSYRVDPEIDVYCKVYEGPDSANLTETYSGLVANHYPSYNLGDTVIASSFNWYESANGELFFPLPLWEMVDRVTQGEVIHLSEEAVSTMTTIALCGVGCLALLIVLKLFGKRSLISRN